MSPMRVTSREGTLLPKGTDLVTGPIVPKLPPDPQVCCVPRPYSSKPPASWAQLSRDRCGFESGIFYSGS